MTRNDSTKQRPDYKELLLLVCRKSEQSGVLATFPINVKVWYDEHKQDEKRNSIKAIAETKQYIENTKSNIKSNEDNLQRLVNQLKFQEEKLRELQEKEVIE